MAVPGPVTDHAAFRKNGITLQWSPPQNPNGKIKYYSITWNSVNETFSSNVTHVDAYKRYTYILPNSTKQDQFNITIRAIGVAGIGNPIYLKLSQLSTDIVVDDEFTDIKIQVIWIASVALAVILGCAFFGFCIYRFKRKPKNLQDPGRSQTLAPISNIPPNKPCSSDLHEMETLITQPESAEVIPNGKELAIPVDADNNGLECRIINGYRSQDFDYDQFRITPAPNKCVPYSQNTKIPILDNNSVNSITENIKTDTVPATVIQVSNGTSPKHTKPLNGFLKTFHHPQQSVTKSSSPPTSTPIPLSSFHNHQSLPDKHHSPKVVRANGNLRITENPQVSKEMGSLIGAPSPREILSKTCTRNLHCFVRILIEFSFPSTVYAKIDDAFATVGIKYIHIRGQPTETIKFVCR